MSYGQLVQISENMVHVHTAARSEASEGDNLIEIYATRHTIYNGRVGSL